MKSPTQMAIERIKAIGQNTPPPSTTPPAMVFNPPPETLTPQELALLEYHRNNLRNGTYLDDAQGMTTVNIMGVTGPDGQIYNVPGYADGRRLSEDEARELAAASGWAQYPSYPQQWAGPLEDHPANVAARRLHDQIDIDGRMFREFLEMGQ